MDEMQLKDWFDIDKFKLAEDDSIVIFEIPIVNQIDFESSRERLLTIFRNVELEMERDSIVYWVKCFKK